MGCSALHRWAVIFTRTVCYYETKLTEVMWVVGGAEQHERHQTVVLAISVSSTGL